jgi:hypothetical protein
VNYDASVCIESNGKKKWIRVGTWIESAKSPMGFCLKLDSVPVGPGWNGFVYAFEKRDRDEPQERPATRPAASHHQSDDDIPF